MADSDVAICNLALDRIGAAVISALDEATAEARACNRNYALLRDAVLEEFSWPFARRYADLALVAQQPNADWQFSYRLPTDCLFARRIVNPAGRGSSDRLPYEIGSDDAGGLVLTDQETPELEYTIRSTNPTLFPTIFASAVAWRVAAEIATPLARSEQIRLRCENSYAVEVRRAQVAAANAERRDADPDASWIEART